MGVDQVVGILIVKLLFCFAVTLAALKQIFSVMVEFALSVDPSGEWRQTIRKLFVQHKYIYFTGCMITVSTAENVPFSAVGLWPRANTDCP